MLVAAGYSGTPLGKKLSLKPGMCVWFDAMPDTVLAEIDMPDLVHCTAPQPNLDAAHIFVTERADMEAKLAMLRPNFAARRFYLGQLAEIDFQSPDRYY
jgi:hypothetical protein